MNYGRGYRPHLDCDMNIDQLELMFLARYVPFLLAVFLLVIFFSGWNFLVNGKYISLYVLLALNTHDNTAAPWTNFKAGFRLQRGEIATTERRRFYKKNMSTGCSQGRPLLSSCARATVDLDKPIMSPFPPCALSCVLRTIFLPPCRF